MRSVTPAACGHLGGRRPAAEPLRELRARRAVTAAIRSTMRPGSRTAREVVDSARQISRRIHELA